MLNPTFEHIPSVLALLDKNDKKRLVFMGIIQFLLSLMDLAALLIIGVMTSLSMAAVSLGPTPKSLSFLLDSSLFSEYSLKMVIGIFGLLSAVILILKTLISASVMKRTIGFLSIREAYISSKFMSNYLKLTPKEQLSKTPQYVAGVAIDGVNCAITRTLGQLVTLIVEVLSIGLLFAGVSFFQISVTIPTAIFFVAVGFFSMKFLSRNIKEAGKQMYQLGISSTQLIQDALSTSREIHVANAQQQISDLYASNRLDNFAATRSRAFIALIPKYISEVALVLGAVFLAVVQVVFGDAQSIITGVVVFLALSSRLIPAILRIQNALLEIRAATAPTLNFLEEYDRMASLPTSVQSLHPKVGTQPIVDFNPTIDLINVTVRFKDRDEPAIDDISMHIESGEFVALVGPSAAGKTTLVDAMIGAVAIQTGNIQISGFSIQEAIKNFPNAIRYVPQDIQIISGTLAANILWPVGVNEKTLDESKIAMVLKQVGLSSWVAQQPKGINAHLSAGGGSMSGGQKQRLGIARALIVSPKLLILDESTSSLDVATEEMISHEILHNLRGITRVVIAHRLSTIKDADRIFYIESGKIRGVGSFQNLLHAIPEFRHAAGFEDTSKDE
jgi:ATP-binding cassette subfamily C protein